MTNPGRTVALGALAMFAVLAIGWTMLTHTLEVARNAAVPVAGDSGATVSGGGITLTADAIVLPDSVAMLPATPAGDLITQSCTACHSVEMITTQPVLPADKWQATIDKMRTVYKAQIDPAQDAALVAALTGLQTPGPAPAAR